MDTCKEIPYEELNAIQVSAFFCSFLYRRSYHLPRISTFDMATTTT